MVSVVEDPMAGLLYALRSPISKKKYPQRLRVFLRFLGLNGVFKDDVLEFLKKAREDPEVYVVSNTQGCSYLIKNQCGVKAAS